MAAAKIGSVAIPCIRSDLDGRLEAIFKTWQDARFHPGILASQRPALLIVVNNLAADEFQPVLDMIARYPVLNSCFRTIELFSADLEGDRDLYARKTPERAGRYGNKAGPNFLFEKTICFAAPFGGFCLQIEIDCVPTQANWLAAIEDVAARNASGWVIGSPYNGTHSLDKRMQYHLNGNALYRAGDANFIMFLKNIWMRRLVELSYFMPNLAYDCWWSVEKARASAPAYNRSWRITKRFDPFFKSDPFLVNLNVSRTHVHEFKRIFDWYAELGERPVFLHGGIMTEVIDLLLESPEASVFDALAMIAEAEPQTRRAVIDTQGMADFLQSQDWTTIRLIEGFNPTKRVAGKQIAWSKTPTVRIGIASSRNRVSLPFKTKKPLKGATVERVDGTCDYALRFNEDTGQWALDIEWDDDARALGDTMFGGEFIIQLDTKVVVNEGADLKEICAKFIEDGYEFEADDPSLNRRAR